MPVKRKKGIQRSNSALHLAVARYNEIGPSGFHTDDQGRGVICDTALAEHLGRLSLTAYPDVGKIREGLAAQLL